MERLNLYEPDECCGAALSAALLDGELDKVETWVHEDCGQEWTFIELRDGSRFWHPHCVVDVIPFTHASQINR